MMKTWLIVIVSGAVAALVLSNIGLIKNIFSAKNGISTMEENLTNKGSFYDFTVDDLEGNPVDLSVYKGKKVVIINTASKCGFTPQYAEWQKFHEKYGDKIAVLGFPANNFMSQEPGSNEEIAEFCQRNYGVTFKMFSKVDVKGKDKAPLYRWLSEKDLNGWNDKEPTWNFCKYVVDENGNLTHFFESKITPDNEQFRKAVGV
ncbi:glutathione peroxidase [Leadbetterella byssophila]|uniref:glutathione peroxidase n=1 Tax=Leadbetterella byssophila TaxID=316068 RepID=UPI00399F36A7